MDQNFKGFRSSYHRSSIVFVWFAKIGFADIRHREHSLVDDYIDLLLYCNFRVRQKLGFFVRKLILYVIHGEKGSFKISRG
jgi:hypothetical protein